MQMNLMLYRCHYFNLCFSGFFFIALHCIKLIKKIIANKKISLSKKKFESINYKMKLQNKVEICNRNISILSSSIVKFPLDCTVLA